MYCNILRPVKAAILEVEKTTLTIATLVPMFTNITPGPHTRSKQSKTFHANSNLKVSWEKNCLYDQKWLYGYYRSQSNSQTCTPRSWHLFFKPNVFHDYCLFNMSDQVVVGNKFSCFWLKNYKKHSFALQHDH